jgi:hypothetical protein
LNFLRKGFALVCCLLVQPGIFFAPAFASADLLTVDAAQAADILGIRQEVEQLDFSA